MAPWIVVVSFIGCFMFPVEAKLHQYGQHKRPSNETTEEQRLLESIFRWYNPVVRPVYTAADTVLVTLSFGLSKIDELHSKYQTLSTSGWITASWEDQRLKWDPKEHGGLDVIVVKPQMVWLPDFVLDNTADSEMYVMSHYKLFRVIVQYDGTCIWEPGGAFRSKCDIDVRLYPFDEQSCELVFANWANTGQQVNITFAGDAGETLLEKYSANGEWDILNTGIYRRDDKYQCCPEIAYPEVHFCLRLRRKPLYYIVNVIIPSVMLSVLVLLVMRLPADSGEKVSMGVTLLISFSVFILMVSDNVPNTSEGVPIIVVYLIFFMGVTSMTVSVAVLVLILHHKDPDVRPPSWLRHLTNDVIGHVLRSRCQSGCRDITGERMTSSSSDSKRLFDGVRPGVGQTGNGVIRIMCQIQNELFNLHHHPADDDDDSSSHPNAKQLKAILKTLAGFQTRLEKEDAREEIRKEWRTIAAKLDMFFARLFFFLLLVMTLTLLVVIPFVMR